MDMQAIAITAITCGLLGLFIGGAKGQPGGGFILGLLLGPLGVIICLIMKPTPAIAAARLEAIETERAKLRDQRDGTTESASQPPTGA